MPVSMLLSGALQSSTSNRGGEASCSSSTPCAPGTGRRRGHKARASASRVEAPLAPAPARHSNEAALRGSPQWAGETFLSKAVNAAISFPPFYAAMKLGAKHVMKSTAHKNGIPWDATVKDLTSKLPELEALRAELEAPGVVYPDYYRQPFHAYDKGNLDWLPAFEVEAATLAIGLRTFPHQGLSAEEAQDRLRGNIHAALQAYAQEHAVSSPEQALDIGCSAGTSTRYLAAAFPSACVTGLDLSPFFLAVAEHRRRSYPEAERQRIRYRHALTEDSGLPSASFDLVSASFVLPECPPPAVDSLLAEARRLLRPGGLLALTDNNPRSATIQQLPPALFTLMKSTEPHSDLYYRMDVEGRMRAAGFTAVKTVEVDHRHRTLLASKPR